MTGLAYEVNGNKKKNLIHFVNGKAVEFAEFDKYIDEIKTSIFKFDEADSPFSSLNNFDINDTYLPVSDETDKEEEIKMFDFSDLRSNF